MFMDLFGSAMKQIIKCIRDHMTQSDNCSNDPSGHVNKNKLTPIWLKEIKDKFVYQPWAAVRNIFPSFEYVPQKALWK